MGARGTGSLFLRGPVWWVSLWVGGKKRRWSTGVRGGSPGKPPKAAEMFRAEKLVELGRGNMAGLQTAPLRWDQAAKILTDRYAAEQRASLTTVVYRLKPLARHFGGWLVRDMTTDQLVGYAVKRREAGAAVATVNAELCYLRRALSLAHEAGRIQTIPKVPRLPGVNVRQGFLEDDQLGSILRRLPAHYVDLVRFLRLTGWREAEGLGLEWRRVDWTGQEIRLDTSKNGEPRCLPFGGYAPLLALLRVRREAADALVDDPHRFMAADDRNANETKQMQRSTTTITPWVFFRAGGKPLSPSGLQKAWKRAARAAGVPWALVHDLRRTFVREMEMAGVPRRVAMTITGHRSETVYRRYAIVATADVKAGLARLAK